MPFTVNYVGGLITFNTIKPIDSKKAAIQKIPSPFTEIELMRFIGSKKTSSKIFSRFHVNMKPL